eukprot:TRINITY_DN2541_c0_g1_i1.p4 TRINITY_DN2541_c0_g1~~TRINITY_DN2541_c0_g1_i1.p4  ORF type:complete len:100 (-),score=0.59 TRINITY_DN2541_c0_g1_i1:1155-1454(-)
MNQFNCLCSKQLFLIHKEVNTKKTFTCPYENCGHQFSESGNLKTHTRIHVHSLCIVDWETTLSLHFPQLHQEFYNKGTFEEPSLDTYKEKTFCLHLLWK